MGKHAFFTEESLAEVKANNDQGLYEEKYLPTGVIHELIRDLTIFKQEYASLLQVVEELQQTNAKIISAADKIDARNQEYIQALERIAYSTMSILGTKETALGIMQDIARKALGKE